MIDSAADGRVTALTEFARAGFADLQGAAALAESVPDAWRGIFTKAMQSMPHAADPDLALRSLMRLAAAHPDVVRAAFDDAETADTLVRLCGCSRRLTDFFESHPSEIAHMQGARLALPTTDEVHAGIQDAVAGLTGESAVNALRVRYRRYLARIAAYDLGAPDAVSVVQDVSAALAAIADAALDVGLHLAREQLALDGTFERDDIELTRLAVIGMGKTGAQELNYVSDVDVIFVGESVDPDRLSTEKALGIATKLASATMRAMDGIALEPALWQVDANLRPEGKAGALVRTLDSHEAYYQRWAKGWEFQALVKARAVAGDLELGRAFEAMVAPLVWSSASSANFVHSVQKMRERVTENIPKDELERQIKLGPGGIRDVEFTVQLLQLVHGLHDERIRQRGTLAALLALEDSGYIGREPATEFSRDYRILRVLEHRVQLRALRRTHLMPTDDAELRVLARSSGLATGAQGVLELWQATRSEIRALHERLFYRPLLDAVARLPREDAVVLTGEQAAARLRAIGFRDPNGALRHIAALTSGVTRKAEIQKVLMPVMLQWFADGTDPDYGLLAFRRVSENLGETHWFLRTLRDSTGAAQRLTQVLSSSHFAGDLLDRMPEAAAWFGSDDDLAPRSLDELLSEARSLADRHEERRDAAKRIMEVRRREVLRLAIASILGLIADAELGVALADVNTMVFRSMVELLDTKGRFGIDFAVIAMGRYGGRELGFASDVDVIYVYRGVSGAEDESAQAGAMAAVAEIAELTVDLRLPLDIDLGLRPEGKNGPPARSLDAYSAYYSRWSAVWEAQALLRAAPVAGDADLLDDMMALVDRVRYPATLDEKSVREIRRIKARVEAERLPRGADPRRHLKLGRGSLSDVEWLVQLKQLQNAHRHPALRTTSTSAALESLSSEGILAPADANVLSEAWRLANRTRSASTLFRGSTADVLPTDYDQLEGIARLLGYPHGRSGEFENDYLRVTRRARHVFEREFYGR